MGTAIWTACAPWAAAEYMIGGPRVIAEAAELGLITHVDGMDWLRQWFEKRPGVSIKITPIVARGAPLYARGYVMCEGDVPEAGVGPLESFGFIDPVEPIPDATHLTHVTIEVYSSEPFYIAAMRDDDVSAAGPTPGEALAELGKKIDQRLISEAWKAKVKP